MFCLNFSFHNLDVLLNEPEGVGGGGIKGKDTLKICEKGLISTSISSPTSINQSTNKLNQCSNQSTNGYINQSGRYAYVLSASRARQVVGILNCILNIHLCSVHHHQSINRSTNKMNQQTVTSINQSAPPMFSLLPVPGRWWEYWTAS